MLDSLHSQATQLASSYKPTRDKLQAEQVDLSLVGVNTGFTVLFCETNNPTLPLLAVMPEMDHIALVLVHVYTMSIKKKTLPVCVR